MKNNHAKDTTDGFALSERQTTVTDSFSMFSKGKSLHELLSEHLGNCSQCQVEIQKGPNGMGMHSRLCSDYQFIISMWADSEGKVNNIVAHDEYGNEASTTIHERYPEQWR